MKLHSTFIRLFAVSILTGLLTACHGGGASAPAGLVSNNNSTGAKQGAQFVATFPAGNVTTNSSTRKAQYISGQGTSSLVVSVVPTDPAEAAVWATQYGASGFTICYPLFVNGVAQTTSSSTVTGPVAGVYTATFSFPSPPGQDAFTITQYSGACSSTNPYAPPTPAPGQTAATQIISQAPTLYVNLVAGASNNFNVQLSACNTPPGGGPINQPSPVTCSVPNPGGTTTITPSLGATVSYAYLSSSSPSLPITLPAAIPLPIQGPMREQTIFTTAGDMVGFPLPVVGLDSNGNPIPWMQQGGVTTVGFLPKGPTNPACLAACTDNITITVSSGSAHVKIGLLDATNGMLAQNLGTTVTLTQLNALDTQDNLTTNGVANDPYVVVAAFDGSSQATLASATFTLNATINGSAITAQTLTVKPQSVLFTAVAAGPANGYTDAAGPYTNAADILNAGGGNYWVSDNGNMHLVGTATYAVAGATTLTGMTLDNNSNLTQAQILAVDNSTATNSGSAAIINGGVFVFNPNTHTSKPLAIQDITTGNYVALGAPQAIAFVSGGYVYAFAGNSIYVLDPQSDGAGGLATDNTSTWYLAEEIGKLPVSGLNSGTDAGFDVVVSGTKLIFADTGNNRIASVDTATCAPGGAACTVSSFATGGAFVGLQANGANYVATDNLGQIYTIPGAGGTATSLGLTHAAAPKDGVVGVIGTTPLVPIPYTTQGQTGNFFSSAPTLSLPYTLSPFSGAAPILSAGAQAAVAGAPLKFAADTSNGTFGTTAGVSTSGFGIEFISAAGANTALTSNSYLFTDAGSTRTLLP